jgi:hypothetical protein
MSFSPFFQPVGETPAEPEVKPRRARKPSGRFKPDDPSTPDVNEAWEVSSDEEVANGQAD